MKISVALCTYNGDRYLEAQLESLLQQTRPPDELVLCDDGSTDKTCAILKEFAGKSPFPTRLYFNEENLGSTANFEQAIGLCAGDIIALCDQDDIWHPEKLERIERAFAASEDVGLVFTDAEIIDEDSRPLGYRLWESIKFGEWEQKKFQAFRAFEILRERPVVTGATMAFRAQFRELILPIPRVDLFIHDSWIAVLLAAVTGIVPLDQPLISYRQHAGQQIGPGRPNENPARLNTKVSIRAAMKLKYQFEWEINKGKLICERLKSRPRFDLNEAYKAYQERLAHVETRAGLPSNKLRRLPQAARELFSGRYHRHANGFYSFVKDLLC